MRRQTLAILVLLIGIVPFLSNCSDNNMDDMGDPPVVAPTFELNSVDGGTVSLADFNGKPLVIFFFGSTCPLCIGSAPKIESDINMGYDASQISIIGIDTWDGNTSAVQNFKSTTGVTFDLLLNGSSTQSSYNTTYDRLFVIDKDGNIVHKGTGAASSDITKVKSVIDGLL